jgi:hypothetical protein
LGKGIQKSNVVKFKVFLFFADLAMQIVGAKHLASFKASQPAAAEWHVH